MLPNGPPPEFAQARACQAERMEIVGQLTGVVVHDLNDILTVIIRNDRDPGGLLLAKRAKSIWRE
jgi:hypothetical protein